ncbi:hypothetical protein SDC9_113539 [bioreactor metagenome]|uniref:Uncharacterized protein n=1 Tax=bioreactor metagenome TaxID=1076179 RepID=A0A645BMC4_9ZZZZ
MQQLTRVHREHHARFACVGQHEARVLGCACSREPFIVPAVHRRHLPFKFGDRLVPKRRNRRRNNIIERILCNHIALRLHRKTRQPVARDLRKQRARHTFNAERERRVLYRRKMPHRTQLFNEPGAVARFDIALEIVYARTAVTKLST